ncbi:hypothetical protein [Neisseria yangbaofengii]|uniref:hypothetical protein n=1 Tax=Neisseria yangbaofengii TaxID=2709396 RepID=UPI0013ECBA40|nr:hypothetical protein [Neisseria yangbaofengii]
MTLEHKKFVYSDSLKQLEQNTDENIPATLLLSEKFIYADSNDLIKFLKNNCIKWIIVIGNDSSVAEENLDFIIETSLDDNFIDIVTTNFSYSSNSSNDIEDLIFEFLITSKLDYEKYQFLGIFDFQEAKEINIINLINSNLKNAK